MATKVTENPGYLEGLSKEFFQGVPYSTTLTRGEQQLREGIRGNELARRGITELQGLQTDQREGNLTANLALQEAAKTREASENALRNAVLGNLAISGRLQGLEEALQSGLEGLGGRIDATGRSIVGIPTERKNTAELIAGGQLDEAEMIILAAKGALSSEQSMKLQRSLPEWKIRIIRSGLVTNANPREEKKLSAPEKIFLAELRRKMATPIESFRSLEVSARHQLLDPDLHHALARDLRSVRFGGEGVNYGVRELNEQADTIIGQNDAQISQGNAALAQGDIAIHQREAAMRLARAGVLQGDQLVGLAKVSTGIQGSSLAVQGASLAVQGASLGVQKDLRQLAQRAEDQRAHLVASSEAIARSTEATAALAQRAEVHRLGILDNTAATAQNTALSAVLAQRAETQRSLILSEIAGLGSTARHFGELQARQMDEAQGVRLLQLQLSEAMLAVGEQSNFLLEEISDATRTVAVYGARQVDELREVNYGLEALRAIGTAHLESAVRREESLQRLTAAVGIVGANIVHVIEAVKASLLEIEARSAERDRSRDQIAADESFREAMLMLKIGEVDDAIECFTKSIDRWRADFRPYLQRGLCHASKSNAGNAQKDFENALKRVPDDRKRTRAVIRLNLARLHYSESKVYFKESKTQEYEEKLLEAIEQAREAINEDPDFLESHFALATYLAAFKLYEEALKILMELIPKNPNYVAKVQHFEEFEPIKGMLKSTFDEEFNEKYTDSNKLKAHLAIARFSLSIGDSDMALKCFRNLIDKGPYFLDQCRFWEDKTFQSVMPQIVNLILAEIESGKERPHLEWYTISSIAINLKGIPSGKVYKAFKLGADTDPAFRTRAHGKIKRKLAGIFGTKAEELFEIIRRTYPTDFSWLTDKL
ncbi:hypothetical protein HY604_02610 [Candidatus Peregrinibacteria bacterium]|nr:hypothetical protein [Candidatus Peregrinibacteria bacterium]